MFDTPITLALFAAFLLGVVAGSGMEIIVRGGRALDSWLDCRVHRRTRSCRLSSLARRSRAGKGRPRFCRGTTLVEADLADSRAN